MTTIWLLIGLFLGAVIGFTACALLTVDKVKPRLPDNLSDCKKIELRAVDVLAVLTTPWWSEPGWVDPRRELAEKVGRQLLHDGLIEFREKKKRDGIKMETEYMAIVRVLKPTKGGT